MTTNVITPHVKPRWRTSNAVRTAAVATIAVAVLAASTAVTPVVSAATTPAGAGHPVTVTPTCPLSAQPPLMVEHPDQAPPATPILRRLAKHLRAVPADAHTGRYTATLLSAHAADSTLQRPCVTTVTAYATEHRWRAADGSGQLTAIPWHHDPANPPPADSTIYPAGGLPGVVPDPVPTDPTALAAALDAAYPPAGTASHTHSQPGRAVDAVRPRSQRGSATRLLAVSDLNAWHYTNQAARRAVLLVLAEVAGLAYRGAVAGYPGAIAVSADSGDRRDLLVIDPTSGVVLAYEQVLLRNGHQLGVHVPYSNARTVHVDRGRTSQPGGNPA